jgi:hypothetical protein
LELKAEYKKLTGKDWTQEASQPVAAPKLTEQQYNSKKKDSKTL